MAKQPSAGRTAYGAAIIKGAEFFVAPAKRLFDDSLIIDFLPAFARFAVRRRPIRDWFTAMMERQAPGIRGALLCRTRAIDDAVNAAAGRGIKTVVILGAGLDTRAYRLPSLAQARVFELDLPSVQAFKKERLLAVLGALPTNVQFIPIDFVTARLDQTLAASGLDAQEPAIFIWEGVTQYLPAEAVDTVFKTIAARPKGTELVFTYVLEEAITGRFRADRSEAFRKSAGRLPEPKLFGIDPSNLAAFLTDRGLTLIEDIGAEEHRARYLDPLKRDLAVSEIERVARAAT